MGIIKNLASGKPFLPAQKPEMGQGRRLWQQFFGQATKEDGLTESRSDTIRGDGGSWTKTSIAAPEATKRLIQAMRSRSPGGWSDNRWEQTQHFKGITYVGIDRVSKQFLMSEFKLYMRDPTHVDGKRLITPDDPPLNEKCMQLGIKPYDLIRLLQRPNRQDSWGAMMYRWSQQLRLTGTALTWMLPNAFGIPMEMYCIPTSIAIPQPAINPDYPDGYYRIQPIYPYGPFSSYPTPATAVGAPIPAQWMLRFQYPHPLLRYDGYSPLTAMNLHIDEVEMMDRSRFYKMKSTVNPTAVLNMSRVEGMENLPQEEIDRIHVEWEQYQGPENAGKLIVGAPGATLDEFGTRPVDMDYVESWDQLTSFVLGGGFGISKPAAGMVEAASYANLFSTLKQLVLLTLDPDFALISEYLTQDLCPFFGDGLFLEIKSRRIDDHEIIFEKIQSGQAAKCITKNQVLKMLEMETTAEPWGMDFAGDPTPLEMQNIQQEMQMNADAMAAQTGAPADSGKGGGMELEIKDSKAPPSEEPQIKKNRPEPGAGQRGALGVPKSLGVYEKVLNGIMHNGENRFKHLNLATILNGRKRKSLYDQVLNAVSNGESNESIV
jgi:phage portal protein BeeE